tara:strand:- start:112 stop:1356 length:1245 start_codon:yes stop_codon:yes gene_type:complete
MIEKKYMNSTKLLRALIFIALFILYSNNLIYASNAILNKVDKNCLWLKYDTVKDSSVADTIINFLVDNKINKVFFETYSNGEILYNQKDEIQLQFSKIDSMYSVSTSNPASYFINRIDSINTIKIYAWMDIYKLWDKNFYPDNKNHFYYKCPECLESDINRRSDKLIKLDKIQSLEWEGIFLSPLHPSVNEYLFEIVKEVLNNYNLDGLLLDHIRYQNYYYGYNEKGLDLFEELHNINPLDLNRGLISKYFGYSESEVDSIYNLWDDYREMKITELVKSIKFNIDNDSLDHELLVAVKESPIDSKSRWYQNWSYWLENNLVDYVVVKNYNLDFNEFNYNNKILAKTYHDEYDLNRIIIGFDSYSDNNINLANKILSLRLQKFDNISLYYYEPYKKEDNWYIPIYNVINFNIDNE